MAKPRALYWIAPHYEPMFFDDALRASLLELVDPLHPGEFGEGEFRRLLPEAELILGTWGMPRLEEDLLHAAGRLRAVFYSAGSVKSFVTPAVWKRGLRVTTAAGANAVPVAEYTVAMVTLALKNILPLLRTVESTGPALFQSRPFPVHGVGPFSTVGVIGHSRIGRLVCEALVRMGLRVLVFDPYADRTRLRASGVEPVDHLEELLRQSHVVSLHAPSTPETRHMLNSSNLGLLQPGATLINTSRGALIDEAALVRELEKGRWSAVLDVTDPEPPAADSPLFRLPNVFLTPHLAGSQNRECRRMMAQTIEEIRRWLAGEPPVEPVTEAELERMA